MITLVIYLIIIIAGLFASYQNAGALDTSILFNPNSQLSALIPSQKIEARDILLIMIGIRNFIMFLGIVLVIISIVLSGIKFMTAQGDEGEIETAHHMLKYALIGAVITIGAFVIMQLIISTIKQEVGFPTLL